MGLAGLTAVFGMGTGVAPPVSSPGNRTAGRQATPAEMRRVASSRTCGRSVTQARPARGVRVFDVVVARSVSRRTRVGSGHVRGVEDRTEPGSPPDLVRRGGRGGQAARLLGPVGCGGRPPCTPGLSTWSSSRSLRCLLAPGNLVSEGASRLDAFSAYPVPTWLPGGAPSGTAGTPEVGPPQSSRTRGDAPQVSYTHGR